MISPDSRSLRFGPFLWGLIVLVIGLLAYVGIRAMSGSSSLLDDSTQRVVPVEPVHAKSTDVQKEMPGTYRQGELDPLFAVLAGPGAQQAAGIRLTGYDGSYADQLADYVRRMSLTRKKPMVHRGEGTALIVIEQSPLGFDELLDLAGHLGAIENKDEKIRLIEVTVDKSLLESPPQPAVLLNPSNARYVEANIQELSKLDNRRIAAAARKLSAVEAPSEEIRKAVCGRLIHLVNDPWGNDADYVRSLALALAVWASPQDDAAFRAVSNVVAALGSSKVDVPESCLVFMAKGDPRKAAVVLEPLWKASPSKLEEIMIRLGPSVEDRVIAVLMAEGAPDELRSSAVRILGETGGRKSRPVLEALKEDRNDAMRLFAEGALRSIEKRANGDAG